MARSPTRSIDELLDRGAGTVLQHLCRHVVALTWMDATVRPVVQSGPPSERHDLRPQMATGFLVFTKGHLFWITAGHVISDLGRLERSGRRIIKARLMTGWHDPAGGGLTPFPLADMPRLWFDHQEFGFDLGAIVIPHHWARLLAAAGVTPLQRAMWATAAERFQRYVLLGFPKETRQISLGRQSGGGVATFGAGTPLMRLERTSRPPEVLVAKHPRFYGKILSMVADDGDQRIELRDIDGMSGGPIFGMRLRGKDLEYRLIGVQGSWGAQSRVVAASLIRPLMTVIARRFDRMVEEAASGRRSRIVAAGPSEPN